MIDVQKLSVHFGAAQVLNDVSFQVKQGESYALVGESGSGKSTILKALSGQIKDWSGALSIAGQTLHPGQKQNLARIVQMVFQDPYGSLHPRRSVDDTLVEPLVIHGIKDRDTRILSMLDAVGLSRRFRFRLPHQLSGGQRQRVAIARALMLEPSTLLLDEPTSALDVSVQAEVLNLLKNLQREKGLTYLLVTHDLPVVSFLCERLAILRDGRISEIATAHQLRNRQLATEFGKELILRSSNT